jgi:hypothetical protein
MNTSARGICVGLCLVFAISGCESNNPAVSPPQIKPRSARGRDFTITKVTPADGNLQVQLASWAAEAKLGERKPFVQFTAEWCRPCRELRANMDDPLMVEAFSKTFIIQIVADDFSDKELEAAGLAVNAIPSFYEIDNDGKPTGRTIDGGAWEENIPSNMAPVLKKFFGKEES